MGGFLSGSSFFFIALTLLVWRLADLLARRTRSPLLHPILVSVAVIIGLLLVLGIPNSVYQQGMGAFSWLMTPATVCLAIPLYEQLKVLRRSLRGILAGVTCGTLACVLGVAALCALFRLDRRLTVSLLPKSVTSAIGAPVSEALGGVSSVTVTVIIATGILGNVTARAACRLFRITDPVAQGAAIGTSAHVIATVKANEMGEVQGAVSSLSLVIAGLLTAFLLPLCAMLF